MTHATMHSSCRHKQLLTIRFVYRRSGWVRGQASRRRRVGKLACLSAFFYPFHLFLPLTFLNVHQPWLIRSQSKWVRPQSQMKVSRLRNLHIFAIIHIMSCMGLDEDNGRLCACLKWRRLPWASVICRVDWTFRPEKHDMLLLNI